jgi:hypothetical protein
MNDADYQEWLRRLAWFESERTAERVRAKLAHKESAGGLRHCCQLGTGPPGRLRGRLRRSADHTSLFFC